MMMKLSCAHNTLPPIVCGWLPAMDGSEAPSPHSTDRGLHRATLQTAPHGGWSASRRHVRLWEMEARRRHGEGNSPRVSLVGRDERFCFTHRLSVLFSHRKLECTSHAFSLISSGGVVHAHAPLVMSGECLDCHGPWPCNSLALKGRRIGAGGNMLLCSGQRLIALF
jgi:hypothetical protein